MAAAAKAVAEEAEAAATGAPLSSRFKLFVSDKSVK